MELFLPSILIFLLAMIVVMVFIPQFSPIIIVTLSIVLLVAGMYNHFSMFWDEYRQSTWQQSLTMFAPGIIIIAIFVYLFFAIGSFFTGGSVPVPSMPDLSIPSAETATNALTSTINDTMSATQNLFGLSNDKKNTKMEPRNEPRNEPRPEPKSNNNNALSRNNVGRLKRPTNAGLNGLITRSQLGAV
jgi:hypothetical protein